jgi:hypothetical protein
MRERGERRVSFRVLGVIFFMGAIGGFAFFAYSAMSQRVTFPDGSTLELAGVTVGTNGFIRGNPLEKILGDRISSKGFSLAGIALQRPKHFLPPADAPLTVWLEWKAEEGEWKDSDFLDFWHSSKVVAANRSGRRLENFSTEFADISSSKVLIAVTLYSFPRDQRTVQLQLIPRSSHGKTVEFEFHNPLRVKSGKWKASEVPSTNYAGGVGMVLLKASADQLEVEFKLMEEGWHMASCRLFDEEGNGGYSWSKMDSLGGSRFRMQFSHGLERDRMWSVNTKWVRAASFPVSETSIFPDDPRVEVKLTSGKPRVLLTNGIGELYLCRLSPNFRGQGLSIEPVNGKERPYWALLEATDETGKKIEFYGGEVSEGIGKQIQHWQTRQANTYVTNLTVTLACAKTVKIEAHWMPKNN